MTPQLAGESQPVPTHVLSQARAYVARMPPAIAGQGGHNATFAVACRLVIDFDLPVDQALPLINEYNGRCQPPWHETDLRRKLQQADEKAEQTGQSRGRLRRAAQQDPYAAWLPLEGQPFYGFVPDFADASAGDVLATHAQFARYPWFFWVFYYQVWRTQRTQVLVADVQYR